MTRCASAFAACARVPTGPSEIVLARGWVKTLNGSYGVERGSAEMTFSAIDGEVEIGLRHAHHLTVAQLMGAATRDFGKRFEIVLREVR